MKAKDLAALAATALAGTIVAFGGAPPIAGQVVIGLAIAILAGALVVLPSRLDGLDHAVLLFLGWAMLSSFLVRPNLLASKETLGMWVGAAVLLRLVRSGAASAGRQIRAVLMVTATLVALGTAASAIFVGPHFPGGLFENPNLTAAVLIAILPLMIMVSSISLRLAGMATTAGAIVLTGSRAGLAALVVVALLLLSGRVRWIAASLAAAAGTALVWWRFATRPDALAWFRLEIWGAVLHLTALHPLMGVSPGGLGDMSGIVRLATPIGCSLHARHIAGAESSFLGILVRTGAVGALLALAAVVVGILAIRQLPSGPDRRAALAAVSGSLVMMLFHDSLQEPSVLWWWAVMAGSMMPREAGSGRPTKPAVAALRFAVAAGAVAWMTVQPPLARLAVAPVVSPEAAARRLLHLEPWDDRAARAAATEALRQEAPWDWKTAGKALYWSDYATRIHPGAAASWALSARVNARVTVDLGAYPTAVEAARRCFEQACNLEPHLPWYWNDWAAFERGLGNLEEARRLASRATREEPNFIRAWLLLARIDLDLGQVDRARIDLQRAREARRCFRGRVLEAYERDLRWAPPWKWQQLEEAIP